MTRNSLIATFVTLIVLFLLSIYSVHLDGFSLFLLFCIVGCYAIIRQKSITYLRKQRNNLRKDSLIGLLVALIIAFVWYIIQTSMFGKMHHAKLLYIKSCIFTHALLLLITVCIVYFVILISLLPEDESE